jgi:hypothetical protein
MASDPKPGQVANEEIGKFDIRVGDQWRNNQTGEVVEVTDISKDGDPEITARGVSETIPAVELETAYLHLGPNHSDSGVARD